MSSNYLKNKSWNNQKAYKDLKGMPKGKKNTLKQSQVEAG